MNERLEMGNEQNYLKRRKTMNAPISRETDEKDCFD